MATNPFLGRSALRLTWLGARLAAPMSRGLAGALAARLWFTPWQLTSPRALEREATWLEGTEAFTLTTPYGRMAGFSAGSGPTVLLVHGWGDRAATLGAFIAPLVERGFRVIGVDLPAHGRSPGTQTNILEVSGTIRAAEEAAGPLHAVIAHSMGAASSAYALNEGLAPSRVAFLAPSVRLEHAVVHFQRLFALPPRAVEGLRLTIERRFGRDVWSELAVDNLVRDLDLPALIVHDRHDPQVAPADVELLAKTWRGARLVTTEGLGHVKIARDPGVVSEVVAFVAADSAGSEARGAAPSASRGR